MTEEVRPADVKTKDGRKGEREASDACVGETLVWQEQAP